MKTWLEDNKLTLFSLACGVITIAGSQWLPIMPRVILTACGGLMTGIALMLGTLCWLQDKAMEQAASDMQAMRDAASDGIKVTVPYGTEFKDSTWRAARMSYADIHAEHHDWKTWDQLSEEQQWMLMAHARMNSLMALEIAKRYNEPQEET